VKKHLIAAGLLAIAAGLIYPGAAATAKDVAATRVAAHTYRGPAVTIGNGTARTAILTDSANRPLAISVELTEGVLAGLPAQPNNSDHLLDWTYYLQFPKAAPPTGFDHVMINWHPLGHVPPGIYTVAHFDIHLYMIDTKSQLAIHYAHSETPDVADVTLPAPALTPPGYFIPPGTQVSRMGVHAVPKAAPEFNGGKFANTLIYGYDGVGRLAFIEPMIALDYLKTRPSDVRPVAVPSSYSFAGDYPARYSVTYDAKRRTYRVIFDQLTPWQGVQASR